MRFVMRKKSKTINRILVVLLVAAFSLMAFACSATDLAPDPGGEIEDDQVLVEEPGDELGQVPGGHEGDDSDLDQDQEPVGDLEKDPDKDGDQKPDKIETDKGPGKTDTDTSGKKLSLTFSIGCHTIFDNLDKINESVLSLQPKNGWIYQPREIEFEEGESVFDILLRTSKKEKIHMEFNSNPGLNSKYVEGINNLYEFDVGELSGWTYKLNGQVLGHGSSSSYPKDGDLVEWVYTCDQGRDVGFKP